MDINNTALIAVGGYGRGELHPHSDIDILLLSQDALEPSQKEDISGFITVLWDIKLQVGHSVRTLSECWDEGVADLSIATNLLESRLICGDTVLFNNMQQRLFSHDFWPAHQFFSAKIDEQKKRHQRYHNTSDNLEPDIKNGPGGLRDIHTLQWISLRYFGSASFDDMVSHRLLTCTERDELSICQSFLTRIRFALHCVVPRNDNRLSFSHQFSVAKILGYVGEGNSAVEQMMKQFYRATRSVSELNLLLLQLVNDTFFMPDKIKKNIPTQQSVSTASTA